MYSSQADRDVNPTEKDVPHSLLSSLRQIEEIKRATSEREKKELRTSYGMKEEPNPMLSLNVDIFQYVGPYKI